MVRMKGLNLILKIENWRGFFVFCIGKFLFGSFEKRRGWRRYVYGILRFLGGFGGFDVILRYYMVYDGSLYCRKIIYWKEIREKVFIDIDIF